jgi:hypothetical protein
MQTVFQFYMDPGHGWIKVPMKLLKELQIEKDISYFSYYRKGHAYLEEDCDMAKFIHAMKEKKNWTLLEQNIKSFHTDRRSKIRNYSIYQKELV